MTSRLPDFMMIGPTRCGTSSLYTNLFRHPRIDGTRKDSHGFFYRNINYERGIEWYKSRFPAVDSEVLLCDASAMYIFSSKCMARICRWIPKAKLIVMLRNPVNRAWSHFCCNRSRENSDWQNLMREDHPVLMQSVYVDLLLQWFGYFDRKQFLIIKSEDYFENPGRELSKCFKFLGLPDMKYESYEYWDPRKKNSRQNLSEHPNIPQETKEWLEQYFTSHTQRLYRLLNKEA